MCIIYYINRIKSFVICTDKCLGVCFVHLVVEFSPSVSFKKYWTNFDRKLYNKSSHTRSRVIFFEFVRKSLKFKYVKNRSAPGQNEFEYRTRTLLNAKCGHDAGRVRARAAGAHQRGGRAGGGLGGAGRAAAERALPVRAPQRGPRRPRARRERYRHWNPLHPACPRRQESLPHATVTSGGRPACAGRRRL